MKITIETTEKVTKELEVKLPYYSKYGKLFYYKVLSENSMIKVTIEQDGNCQMEKTKYMIDSAFRDGTIEINSTEFHEALFNVNQIITNK